MKKKTVAEELDEFFSDDSSDDIVLYDVPKKYFHTKHPFLRKGEGKLASHKHGTTNFTEFYFFIIRSIRKKNFL